MGYNCDRCGRELLKGDGRYILTMTFLADVDEELSLEGADKVDVTALLREIEDTPEDKLMAQVYEKRAFILCRPCKEDLSENPFDKARADSSLQ